MVAQVIAPIIGNQETAIAASQGVIFTATDRKLIEEIAGEVNRNRPFIDIFSEKPLSPKVENEQTSVKPHEDVKELEGRLRAQQHIIKYSVLTAPREHVEITGQTPDEVVMQEDAAEISMPKTDTYEKRNVNPKTVAIAQDLKLDPIELFDKFKLEEEALFNLIYRIRELHLKRLLTGSCDEFEALTGAIKSETLAAGRPEAKAWLETQLNDLTRKAAEYKLKLIRSLQSMHCDDLHDPKVRWLQKIIKQHS